MLNFASLCLTPSSDCGRQTLTLPVSGRTSEVTHIERRLYVFRTYWRHGLSVHPQVTAFKQLGLVSVEWKFIRYTLEQILSSSCDFRLHLLIWNITWLNKCQNYFIHRHSLTYAVFTLRKIRYKPDFAQVRLEHAHGQLHTYMKQSTVEI